MTELYRDSFGPWQNAHCGHNPEETDGSPVRKWVFSLQVAGSSGLSWQKEGFVLPPYPAWMFQLKAHKQKCKYITSDFTLIQHFSVDNCGFRCGYYLFTLVWEEFAKPKTSKETSLEVFVCPQVFLRNWQPHFLASRKQAVHMPWEGFAISHLPDTKVQNNRSWLFGEVMFQHPAIQLKPVQVSPGKRRDSFEPGTKEVSHSSQQWGLMCYKMWTKMCAICPGLLHDIWKTHNKCLRSRGDIILAVFQSGNRTAKVQSVRVKAGSTEQSGQPKML